MTLPKKGVTFTHKHFLHPEDRHLRAAASRKAEMVISRVTSTRVYYKYAGHPDSRGWHMPREFWIGEYGGQ